MIAWIQRAGPAGLLIAGWVVGALMFRLEYAFGGQPAPGVNRYPVFATTGYVVIGCCSLWAASWWSYRGSRLSTAVLAAGLFLTASAVALPFALDLLWLLRAGELPVLLDSCGGGMDCISEPMPEVPLTGDGTWLFCFGFWASVPMLGVGLIKYSEAMDRRRAPTTPMAG